MEHATTGATATPWPARIARAACGAALAAALAIGAAAPAFALPANPEPLGLTQPDGSAVEVNVRGDENFNFTLNENGAVVLKDADGTWRQVVAEQGGLSLGARAEAGTAAGALTADDLTGDAARSALYRLQGKVYRGEALSQPAETVTLDDVRTANRSLDGQSGFRSAGSDQATLPLLLIVVGFEDQPYSTTYDWAQTFFTADYSISSLYDISSNGKFTWAPAQETSAYEVDGNTSPSDAANDGILHITLPHKYGNLDSSTDEGWPNYIATLEEIIDTAAKYTDFASYDANGNGAIEPNELGLGIVFAGYEAATGYVPEGNNGIWSHQWEFSAAVGEPYKIDLGEGSSVTIDKYIIQSETEAYANGNQYQSGIGALGHELGHFLGLPDLYDTADETGPYSEYYVGYLSLMAGGSWGYTRSGEYRPTFLDPYSKIFLGYIEPTEITADGTYTVTSQMSDEGYSSYLIRINENEYYVIENRQYESFDEGMDYSFWKGTIPSSAAEGQPDNSYAYENPTGGVVVWHIDNGIAVEHGLPANSVNVMKHRPGVMPAYPELENVGNKRPLQFMPFLNANSERVLGTATTPLLAYNGSDDPAGRVDTGIRVTSTDEGAKSMTFTVDFPGELSDGTANGSGSAVLESDGGTVALAVAGTNLNEGDIVTAQVTDLETGQSLSPVTLSAAGTDRAADAAATTYTGSVAVPGNSGDADRSYSVAFALNGQPTGVGASITVKKPEPKLEPKPEPTPGAGQGQGKGDVKPQESTTKVKAKATAGRRLPKTGDASLALLAGAAVSGIGAIATARGIRRRNR
ncbi:MAG: M6 family metalloprotease domain-containing protein [Collinsella sp.]|nr:M6 family metalloprotease domain-containing protein [Collinsella sp.]